MPRLDGVGVPRAIEHEEVDGRFTDAEAFITPTGFEDERADLIERRTAPGDAPAGARGRQPVGKRRVWPAQSCARRRRSALEEGGEVRKRQRGERGRFVIQE
jgi:hypothetical protein